jgi:hypothetical protein
MELLNSNFKVVFLCLGRESFGAMGRHFSAQFNGEPRAIQGVMELHFPSFKLQIFEFKIVHGWELSREQIVDHELRFLNFFLLVALHFKWGGSWLQKRINGWRIAYGICPKTATLWITWTDFSHFEFAGF